jgi:ribosomal protein L11 methyltransferase
METNNNYIAYHFEISPVEIGTEILLAALGELPFESFEENEKGLSAYIQKKLWNENVLETLDLLSNPAFQIKYTVEEIQQVNWNEEWEKNFEPIDVDGICHVRAPFYPKTTATFDIIIEPKMSFGTGHHETTHMMIQHLLNMDVKNLKTLDMGSGTAILAILAELKGAKPIDAIDIDNWCYLNAIENAARNNCTNISVFEGDAALLQTQKYDVIIANINRNILLADMATYVKTLNPKGTLLLSGFYTIDIPAIDACCAENGLQFVSKIERNNWVALKYQNQ